MAIPEGITEIQWMRKQTSELGRQAARFQFYSEDWSNLTTAQKNRLKAQVAATIASVKAELDAVLAAVQAR